jgi:hypothetical protein
MALSGCESEGCGLLRGIKKPSTFPSANFMGIFVQSALTIQWKGAFAIVWGGKTHHGFEVTLCGDFDCTRRGSKHWLMHLETFKQFPPLQAPETFNLSRVMEQVSFQRGCAGRTAQPLFSRTLPPAFLGAFATTCGHHSSVLAARPRNWHSGRPSSFDTRRLES